MLTALLFGGGLIFTALVGYPRGKTAAEFVKHHIENQDKDDN